VVSKFIIYGLTDPRTDEVRYIGKSCVGLARPRSGRYRAKCGSWIASLKSLGMRHGIVVLGEFDTSDGLYEKEQWAIVYGRSLGWRLTNMTDGGPGLQNPSPETRARCSAAHKGRRMSPEAIAKMKEAQRRRVEQGWKPSAETLERMRKAQLGRKQSPDAIMRSAMAHRGLRRSEETRRKMSEAAKIVNADPARRKRLSEVHRDRVFTEEHRAKMRAAWERRKLNGGLEHLARMRAIKAGTVSA
jgi:hypothetical protein